jgi:signal transduction histidine kinase
MTDQSEVLDAVLGEWSGRWLYPELAVAIESGERRPDALAAALVTGLTRAPAPVLTANWLIENEELDVLDTLLAASVLSAEETAEVGELRAQANARLEARLRREWTALADRARRVGTEPPDAPLLAGTGEEDFDPGHRQLVLALQRLDEERDRIAGAEKDRVKELERLFQGRRAETDDQEWAHAVTNCIGSGRFDAAQRLIEMGPSGTVSDEPLDVPRLRPAWAFPDAEITATDLLSWCLRERTPPAAEYLPWLPRADDTTALDLVRAMRRTLDGLDHHSVLEFVLALQRLTGGNPVRHTAEVHDGGVLTRIRLRGDDDLPPLAPTVPAGLPTWIAPAGCPPPSGTDPALWIMLGPDTPVRAGDEGAAAPYARIDLLAVISLLTPGPDSGVPSTRRRSVNLLRLICSRLPVRRAIATSGRFRVLAEHELPWLLDLLGITADAVAQDLLRYETGGNPLLLTELLAHLAPEDGRPRAHVAEIAAIDAARRNEVLIRRMRRHLESVLTDHTAAALFRTAALYYWEHPGGEFDIDQLQADMAVLLAGPTHLQGRLPEARESLRAQEENLPAALDGLVRAGLFVSVGPRRYALPFNGIRDLFGAENRARSGDLAISSVHRMNDHVFMDPRLIGSGYGDQMVRLISHHVENEFRRLGDLLGAAVAASSLQDATEPTGQAHDYVRDFEPIRRRYVDCMTEPRVQTVEPLLRAARNRHEATWGGVHLELTEIGGPLHVRVNDHVFTMVIGDFLRNAADVTADPPRGRATITVRPGGEWCVISIEDNGPGFAASVATGVSGEGNALARQVIEGLYDGNMAVLSDGSGPAGLRGAHIQISLPLFPETSLATAAGPADRDPETPLSS